jgi:hypothetical protein
VHRKISSCHFYRFEERELRVTVSRNLPIDTSCKSSGNGALQAQRRIIGDMLVQIAASQARVERTVDEVDALVTELTADVRGLVRWKDRVQMRIVLLLSLIAALAAASSLCVIDAHFRLVADETSAPSRRAAS